MLARLFAQNEGKLERIIRVALAVALMAVALPTLSGTWLWVAAAVSIILFLTGAFGVCPLYSVIGMVTRRGQICPTCSEDEKKAATVK